LQPEHRYEERSGRNGLKSVQGKEVINRSHLNIIEASSRAPGEAAASGSVRAGIEFTRAPDGVPAAPWECPVPFPLHGQQAYASSTRCRIGMRKALSISDLREPVKQFKIIVVVNAAILGLVAV